MPSSLTDNPVLMPASDTLLNENETDNTTFFNCDDKKVQALMDKHLDLYQQLTTFKSNLAGSLDNDGEQFETEDSERTDTIQRAQYRLTPTWRLIKTPGGRFGLIAVKGDESLMNNVQLEQAVLRFERTLSEISNLRHLLTHNRQLEQKNISQRQQATNLRLTNLQQERSLINNQIGKVMAAKAGLIAELHKSKPDSHKIHGLRHTIPSPISTHTQKPSVSITPDSHQFKQLLTAIKKLTNTQSNQHKLSLDNANKMIPGAPIPRAIMKNLHKHPDKIISSEPSTRGPVAEQKNNKTPFKLTPSPFNH